MHIYWLLLSSEVVRPWKLLQKKETQHSGTAQRNGVNVALITSVVYGICSCVAIITHNQNHSAVNMVTVTM